MKVSTLAIWTLSIATSQAFAPRASFGVARPSVSQLAVSKEDLEGASMMIDGILDRLNANPVFVRLAWHDSGTFDKDLAGDWPAQGGAIGSIRFEEEITHGANNGLKGAAQLLEEVKAMYPKISYADIYQMASARSIENAGGPKIDMRYGECVYDCEHDCVIIRV
jgi:L-ascorbate peroxidase